MNSNFNTEGNFKSELIIEYFKQARLEINIRIQANISFILQKIVTCGAGLGFLLSHQSGPSEYNQVPLNIQLLGLVLIPIIAMLYDVLIARNIKGINLLANFVRTEIEPLVPEITLWETHLYNRVYQSKSISVEGILLAIFTLGTELIAAYVYLEQDALYLLPVVLILFTLHGYVFRVTQRLRTYSPVSTSPDLHF